MRRSCSTTAPITFVNHAVAMEHFARLVGISYDKFETGLAMLFGVASVTTVLMWMLWRFCLNVVTYGYIAYTA